MTKTADKFPLIIESYPEGYKGSPFITLIEYQKENILTIIDNHNDKTIRAFVLDRCGPEEINEEALMGVANEWFYDNNMNIPFSVLLSRKGILNNVKKIQKTFTINFITRIIGPLPKFEMNEIRKIKRKKRKELPENIEVNLKPLNLFG